MRTDVGTFVFRIPSPIDGAKITVEYANSTESIVFHLSHHLPDRTATVQLSGLLLEIEAKERLAREVWQDQGHKVAKRWERDVQCTECGQKRQPFCRFCDSCSRRALEALLRGKNED